MNIASVYDSTFVSYGKVLVGYETKQLIKTLEMETPLPEGVMYVASQPELEALPIAKVLQDNAYGGMPIQLGYCNGHNTKLNCLEYHRDSEVNVGTTDFILLVARVDELQDGCLNTAKIKAFLVPAGVVVEIYATTLHYAPCSAKSGQGFRVLVVLPRGTNGPKPDITSLPGSSEDCRLWACNKWLLAHPESSEAAQGAVAALNGVNIDISSDLNRI